jgi:hypothetical protein
MNDRPSRYVADAFGSLSRSERAASGNQMHKEQHDSHDEEHVGNLRSDSGDSRNTECARDEPEDEKHQRVIQHHFLLNLPFTVFGSLTDYL